MAKFSKIPRILARATPSTFARGLPFEQCWYLRWFFTVIKELIERDLESASHFLQCFNGGNCVTIFHAGDIAPD
jgi:hypothetical protein